MNIPPDKLMHLKLGVPLALLLTVLAYIAAHFGIGYSVAAGSVAFGIGVELYQKMRNEGTLDWMDAVCSAAAGVVLGVVIALT